MGLNFDELQQMVGCVYLETSLCKSQINRTGSECKLQKQKREIMNRVNSRNCVPDVEFCRSFQYVMQHSEVVAVLFLVCIILEELYSVVSCISALLS
jgi:hypothetical protein